MEIDLQTKIGALLDAYPALEETLLELSPAFSKLRNPVLRRTVARVTTVQQAAKMAGIEPADMVRTLRRAAGLSDVESSTPSSDDDEAPEKQPDWFDERKIAIRYDARPVIEAGESPLPEILRLSDGLKPGDIMVLIAPFRPEPVMDLLRSKGFGIWYDDGRCYIKK